MEEEELEFKRFPKEKQEQVRQLVAYANLMGLDGKDLVSIGGKLERLKSSNERRRRMDAISQYKIQALDALRPVKENATFWEIDNRIVNKFKIYINNIWYTVEISGNYFYGGTAKVTSPKTKKPTAYYITPAPGIWGQRIAGSAVRHEFMWQLYTGEIVLK